MDRTSLAEWEKYKAQRQAFPDAAERGRLLAASLIIESEETRKRMEDRYGVDFCRINYPEAYRSGFGKLLDKIRRFTPW